MGQFKVHALKNHKKYSDSVNNVKSVDCRRNTRTIKLCVVCNTINIHHINLPETLDRNTINEETDTASENVTLKQRHNKAQSENIVAKSLRSQPVLINFVFFVT